MTSKRLALLAAAVFLPAAFLGAPRPGLAGKMAPGLERALSGADPGAEVPVIVRFADRADISVIKKEKDRSRRKTGMIRALKDKAVKSQAGAKGFLESKGVRKVQTLWLINGMALSAAPEVLSGLSTIPEVSSITLDDAFQAPAPSYGEPGAPEWNIGAVRADGLWSMGYTGAGVTVGSMDTGVDPYHQDLAGRWRGGTNSWFDPHGEHASPYDMNGHGTQTMGILAGGSAGGSAIGMAPGAEWVAVKIFNDSGTAYFSSIHLGFQWLLDPDGDPATDDSPRVVSNSWGIGGPNDCNPEFSDDVDILKTAGVYVVFAAGNYGPGSMTSVSPANNAGGFGVGSVDPSFTVDASSSRGPSCDGNTYPEVSAPGAGIRTADLTFGGLFPDSYAVVSGTSYSAPHAGGVATLLSEAFPAADVQSLEAAILQSATDRGTQGADNDYGHGVVDALAAYGLLSGAAGADADGDGYPYGNDCNDADPSVHPGAPEVKHDGVDQDCNGYDLTIDIVKASYSSGRDTLSVSATSSLAGAAALELAGYGPMSWNRKKGEWSVSARGAGANPGTVAVSGPEGSETASVTESSSGPGKRK